MPRRPIPSGMVAKGYLAYTKASTEFRVEQTPPSPNYQNSCSDSSSKEARCSEPDLTFPTPIYYENANIFSGPRPSMSPVQSCPAGPAGLLRLPPEIRVAIFRELFTLQDVQLKVPVLDLRSSERIQPTYINISYQPRSPPPQSALRVLEVCRLFYREALAIFYQSNTLRLSSPTMLYNFLRTLPKARRNSIRRLRIGGVGFHYSGWQLARRAFSMLNLCRDLQTLEIELALDSEASPSIPSFVAWKLVLSGTDLKSTSENLPLGHALLAAQELQLALTCIMSLRGLHCVELQMAGSEMELTTFSQYFQDEYPSMTSTREIHSIWKFIATCTSAQSRHHSL